MIELKEGSVVMICLAACSGFVIFCNWYTNEFIYLLKHLGCKWLALLMLLLLLRIWWWWTSKLFFFFIHFLLHACTFPGIFQNNSYKHKKFNFSTIFSSSSFSSTCVHLSLYHLTMIRNRYSSNSFNDLNLRYLK